MRQAVHTRRQIYLLLQNAGAHVLRKHHLPPTPLLLQLFILPLVGAILDGERTKQGIRGPPLDPVGVVLRPLFGYVQGLEEVSDLAPL